MKKPWIFITNTFEVNTRNSRPVAFSFFTDFKAKLEAASLTDPAILIIFNDYLPFFTALEGIYMNLLMIEGEYEGRTLSFEDLLEDLNDIDHLRKWEGKIRAEFPEDSPTEKEIFPNKRTPFLQGTYENRVLTVKTLAQKLLQYPALSATQMEVQSFANLMESTREAQQNHEGSLANLRTLFENQRLIIADETFGAYGRLCHIFRTNRPMIANFFDLTILRDSGADWEEFDIASGEVLNLMEDVQAGDLNGIKIRNTSPAASGVVLYIYTTNVINGGWNGAGITLNPGEEKTLDENDFGALQSFLNVQNQSGNAGGFEVKGL
ncbi:MAG: hypothetical protein POELPBGB_00901 [Bacteroidia bacterium]|nr:hypothetical protein [Bacteroidia bacterium]